MQYVFDYTEGDIFACVSDLGWLSGHTSVVYGPLCNGATTVLFEGTATYPNEGKTLLVWIDLLLMYTHTLIEHINIAQDDIGR